MSSRRSRAGASASFQAKSRAASPGKSSYRSSNASGASRATPAPSGPNVTKATGTPAASPVLRSVSVSPTSIDRATAPPKRYQRDEPGELVHVDVKKLAGIPDGGGWKARGRGYAGEYSVDRQVGYRYLHTALDDRSRLVYSEILDDERAVTAAAFWARAAAWFASHGIRCERVITDNGSCYKSGLWHQACAATATSVKKTRPRRPQTNGKVERYHRILLEEWAYIRPWTSERQRHAAYARFVHFYNHHRSHGALGWATPISTITDNLPAQHS